MKVNGKASNCNGNKVLSKKENFINIFTKFFIIFPFS